jgi:hypothetical protein
VESNKLGKGNEEELLGQRRPAEADVLDRITIGIRSLVST